MNYFTQNKQLFSLKNHYFNNWALHNSLKHQIAGGNYFNKLNWKKVKYPSIRD